MLYNLCGGEVFLSMPSKSEILKGNINFDYIKISILGRILKLKIRHMRNGDIFIYISENIFF